MNSEDDQADAPYETRPASVPATKALQFIPAIVPVEPQNLAFTNDATPSAVPVSSDPPPTPAQPEAAPKE